MRYGRRIIFSDRGVASSRVCVKSTSAFSLELMSDADLPLFKRSYGLKCKISILFLFKFSPFTSVLHSTVAR